MTQTSEAPSLNTLLDQAYDLHAAIAARMDSVQNNTGPVQPDEWNDLHIALQAANIAAAQLHAMIGRQRAADQPVPYVLADGQ